MSRGKDISNSFGEAELHNYLEGVVKLFPNNLDFNYLLSLEDNIQDICQSSQEWMFQHMYPKDQTI